MGRKSIPRTKNTPSKRMMTYIVGRLLGKQFITMATSIARGCVCTQWRDVIVTTRASNAETQLLGYYSVAMGQIPRSTERIFSLN